MPAPKTIAEQLFDEAFTKPRDPRSPEYKAGVLAALQFRLDRKRIVCSYQLGTSRADVFFSGLDEGHSIYRRWEASKKGED